MPPVERLPGLEKAMQRMPFDQFGRYHMLRETVDACREHLAQSRLSILDVGGFYDDHGTPSLPIKEFLPTDDVTVLDVVPCQLPGYIQGDGTALDFADSSFDLVVSADTLEHIPQPQRAAFWRELLRVARHGVILLAPFATPEVEAAETLLFEYIKTELHAEHQQLKEHREYGLPVLGEWMGLLVTEQVAARAYPTGYLHAWLGMMLIKHLLLRVQSGPEMQHVVDTYYNQNFFMTERRHPAYRALIVAQKTPGLVEAVDAVLAPTIMPDQRDAADWGQAMLPAMLTIVQRQLASLREEYQHLHQQHAHHIEAQRQTVSFMERVIADQQMMITRLQQDISRQQLAQSQAALQDMTERAHWLDLQNQALRQNLEAIQSGRVLRILNTLRGKG